MYNQFVTEFCGIAVWVYVHIHIDYIISLSEYCYINCFASAVPLCLARLITPNSSSYFS